MQGTISRWCSLRFIKLTSCETCASRFLTLEDVTDRLSRNVGDKLPLHAA